jgi:hypothetical protein
MQSRKSSASDALLWSTKLLATRGRGLPSRRSPSARHGESLLRHEAHRCQTVVTVCARRIVAPLLLEPNLLSGPRSASHCGASGPRGRFRAGVPKFLARAKWISEAHCHTDFAKHPDRRREADVRPFSALHFGPQARTDLRPTRDFLLAESRRRARALEKFSNLVGEHSDNPWVPGPSALRRISDGCQLGNPFMYALLLARACEC